MISEARMRETYERGTREVWEAWETYHVRVSIYEKSDKHHTREAGDIVLVFPEVRFLGRDY